MNNQNQTLLIGALMGGLVGAAAVLLSTPYSGARLRSKIMNGIPHESPKAHHVAKPVRRKKAAVKVAGHKTAAPRKAANHKH